MFNRLLVLVSLFCTSFTLVAQTTIPVKTVNDNLMFWTSLNSVFRFSERWGAVADFHYRSRSSPVDPNFYFARVGGAFFIAPNLRWTMGYAHLWLVPQDGKSTWQNENRYYNELLYTTKPYSFLSMVQRLRVEERWQEVIVNDQKTGDTRFTNRVRYLLSLNFQVFKNEKLPSLVLADEILLNFGKQVVYNTFDQNRLFLGIRQSISSSLSFDFGYMNVYQQKSSGNVFDNNHTVRLFFYYNLDLRKKGSNNPGLATPTDHENGE